MRIDTMQPHTEVDSRTGGRPRPKPAWSSEEAKRRTQRIVRRSAGYLVLIALAAASAFPLLWMVTTSIRPSNTVFTGGWIPETVTFDAYQRAWTQLNFGSHFWTSVWITTSTCVLVVALATLSGYAFAKFDFPAKQVIFVILLTTLMLPATAIIIPLFLELKALNLLDTRQGLILVYVGISLPFSMFLMRAFFETLPDELIHAARVDGASEFTIFWRIMLPLAAPGVATVLIFQFMQTWNEFLFAQTFLQTPAYHPLQPMLYSLVGQYSTDWTLLTASLTMSVLPVIVVYIRLQKRFVAGLTAGAVKD